LKNPNPSNPLRIKELFWIEKFKIFFSKTLLGIPLENLIYIYHTELNKWNLLNFDGEIQSTTFVRGIFLHLHFQIFLFFF